MNEDNPPMVAPNGAVFSEKAVNQIATQNNGMFKNPETGTCVQLLYLITRHALLKDHAIIH